MSAPTQELPPWLSYSTITYTDAAGVPFTTSSSLVYLPLTYYGPSIPLGTLFTYGGLTSPASSESTQTLSTETMSTLMTSLPLTSSPSSPATPPSTIATIPFTLMSSLTPVSPPVASLTSFPTTAIPPSSIITTSPISFASSTATVLPTLTSITVSSPSGISSSLSPSLSITMAGPTSLNPSLSPTITVSSLSGIPSSISPSLSTTMPKPTSLTPSASSTISASPLPLPNSFSNASRNAIVAIVLGAILGSVFLLLLALLCLRWRVRRNRNQQLSEFGFETPVWANWMIVDAARHGLRQLRGQNRNNGEGVPRESGEEVDPFLTHRASAHSESLEGEPVAGPSVRVVRSESSIGIAHQAGAANTRGDDDDDSSGSGYGTLLERFPSTTVGGPYGHIIQPEDLLKLDNQQGPSAGNGTRSHSPLSPPPPLDPDRIVGFGFMPSSQKLSHRSLASNATDADEAGTLLTARRVRVQEMGLRPRTHASTAPPPGPSSSRGFTAGLGQGLGALAGLRRLSWLKKSETSSQRASYVAQELSDKEVEAGKALLGSQSLLSVHGNLGVGPDGTRPMSGVSARSASAISGNSLYFDAPSSLPGTPELSPLPRAFTPSSPHRSEQHTRPTSWVDFPLDPPPYQQELHLLDTQSPTQTNLNLTFPPETDILDIPAPPPASPFGSASPWGSSSSSRDSGNLPFSPGLAFLTAPRPWQDISDGSPSYRASASNSDRVTVDVLEEEPPSAADRWRTMAAVAQGPRRSTFGLPHVVHQIDTTTSQQGSLHSMRAQSSGSGLRILSPSDGSASSRISAMRSMGSANSRASLAQGSGTSDGRLLQRETGAQSPAVSAFGVMRPPVERGYRSPYPSPPRSPVALRPATEPRASSDPAEGPVSTTGEEATYAAESTNPTTGLSDVPWATGLEKDWNPK